ncbi:hypothetical protein AVEN_203049-1 [Araneus ventricosus]|uniref:Uncharacterized protein n=1 Tax=Araneus ventricosus TaxID=182803 RepID=A0A4Y2GEM5_ARAVE|nr:hypothetical protein AVEN_203049-1 [Araneus ventricosus]
MPNRLPNVVNSQNVLNVMANEIYGNELVADSISNDARSDSKNRQNNGCFIIDNVEQKLIPPSEFRFASPEIPIKGKSDGNELVADSTTNNARSYSRNQKNNGCFTTYNL